MSKMYRTFTIALLGILFLAGTAKSVFAQCDPRVTGTNVVGTSQPNNIATILVGETGKMEFSFGVGPLSGCDATAGNVAGSITLTLTFPVNYVPVSNVVTGPHASLYNWTYNAVTRQLVGVNNALVPRGSSPIFSFNVIGVSATPGQDIPVTSIVFTTTSTPPITDGNTGNNQLSIGFNVDPALLPPVATDDNAGPTSVPIVITVLTNDTPGSSPIDPTKVMLIDPVSGTPSTSVTIPGEGSYVVNTTTGVVTFTPEVGLTTPVTSTIKYTITDTNNLTSVPANINVNVIPLPVTLVSFTVKKEGQVALLNWATTEETNSDYFEIQHSVSGKEWENVGQVNSSGESKVLKKYSFNHANPVHGQNLYRLKMIDKDQTFAYSRIQSVSFEGIAAADLSVYPNPSTDKLFVRDNGTVKEVVINNLNGNAVYHAPASFSAGNGQIDLTGLPQGMYIVKVTRKNGLVSTSKVVVSK